MEIFYKPKTRSIEVSIQRETTPNKSEATLFLLLLSLPTVAAPIAKRGNLCRYCGGTGRIDWDIECFSCLGSGEKGFQDDLSKIEVQKEVLRRRIGKNLGKSGEEILRDEP